MDNKIDRLPAQVERLLLHVGHHIPPDVVEIDALKKLVADIRNERNGLASDNRFRKADLASGEQSASGGVRTANEAGQQWEETFKK